MGNVLKATSGCLMKDFESVWDIRLPRLLPTVIRLDGRAFHAWTRKSGCQRPFDLRLMDLMEKTALYLCENITGCVLAYTQSDEISLLLVDDHRPFGESWFQKRVQKMCSLSAALATCHFNAHNVFERKLPALFDARVFVLPGSEVPRYFIWRQKDAVRNSLQMLAQSFYSHGELMGKKRAELMDLCHGKGENWAKLQKRTKRGACVYRRDRLVATGLEPVVRRRFEVDREIPTFTTSAGARFFGRILKARQESCD